MWLFPFAPNWMLVDNIKSYLVVPYVVYSEQSSLFLFITTNLSCVLSLHCTRYFVIPCYMETVSLNFIFSPFLTITSFLSMSGEKGHSQCQYFKVYWDNGQKGDRQGILLKGMKGFHQPVLCYVYDDSLIWNWV